MPWSTSFAGLSARALGWASSAIASIYDNFARITSGALGTATSGQIWTAVNGVWYANSGVAQTASSPSTYPSARFTIADNAVASVVSPSPGAGVMVWETDSGDWWGAATYVTETSTPTYGCISNSCCTGSPPACVPDFCCGGIITYSGSPPTPHCTGGSYNACCTMSANTCVANGCCSVYLAYTTYYWSQFLTILKSVASAVSTVDTTPNLGTQSNRTGAYPGSLVNSLSVTTLGTTITAKAYSDTAFASILGTLVDTNSGATGTGVGILMTPSSGVQGTTVGPFSAS